jgi:tripeptide aminopeptidase
MGVPDVRMDRHGYVMASIPSNLPKGHPAVPAVGFIAHVDTSEAASGKDVKPQVFEYKGGDIALPGDPSSVIKADCPRLKDQVGKRIVTSDGTTLLGADDKAGVATIMTAADRILQDPGFLHGEIRIAFTPDEEVGGGTKFFDLKAFGARVAYTLDGHDPGQLNKETFSADTAVITVHGWEVHPGTAKDLMVNSIRAVADVVARLPKHMAPETTEGYQPYIHPYDIHGSTGQTVLKLLLRDFKTEGLSEQKRILERIIKDVQPLHPKARFELKIVESYRNMRAGLEKDPRVLDILWAAVEQTGLKPRWEPIRGGTDGARLTAQGLPTPNLFVGGGNYHSKTEWVSVDGMEQACQTVLNIVKLWAEKSQ